MRAADGLFAGIERLHNPSVKDRQARSLPPPKLEAATCDRVTFRSLGRPDLRLLADWLREPHVARWWRQPFDLRTVEAKYGPYIDGVEPTHLLLIEFDEMPIGLIQWYRWADYSEHADKIGASRRSAGVDLLIGRPDMIGLGIGPAAIWKLVTELIFLDPGIDAVVSDPEEANARSLRAFAKAGFQVTRKLRLPGETEIRCIVRLPGPVVR
jgi:RimJ/RimL family protein N-acetyltransferase